MSHPLLEEAPHPISVPSTLTVDNPSFIPGTNIQLAWDSTSLGLFKRCPRLYQYIMIEGWSRGVSLDLRFGIEFHTAMQDYAKERVAGYNHDEAVFDVIRELMIRIDDWRPTEEADGKKAALKNREYLIRRVIWHLDDHRDDPAETYILANGKPAVELSFAFELDYGPSSINSGPYILCGHLDRVVSYNGDLFTEDYKTTTKTVSSYFFDQFQPDNQMTLYTLAGQTVLKEEIKGVLINGVQIGVKPETNRTVRSFTFRTKGQIEEWLRDLRWHLQQAEVYATRNYWPQNDTACDKYGGCPFRSICSKDPEVRQAFLESNFEKGERWNPLKPR